MKVLRLEINTPLRPTVCLKSLKWGTNKVPAITFACTVTDTFSFQSESDAVRNCGLLAPYFNYGNLCWL